MNGAVVALTAGADLATCEDIGTVMEIRNKAETMARYLKEHTDAEGRALEAAIVARRAERQLGELIRDLPASRWQRIATIPEERFESHLRSCDARRPPTMASVLRLRERKHRPRKLRSVEAALSAWGHLDEKERAGFLERLGLVSVAKLDTLRAQREADPEYAQFRQTQRTVEAHLPCRGAVMVGATLDGIALAMVRLGLTWESHGSELDKAWSREAKRAHPDTGGSAENFRRLKQDRDLIDRLLDRGRR